MADKDFIVKKLLIMKKDKQDVFDKLADPLQAAVEKGSTEGKINIPADGNWFTISFDAVEVKKDRLVITANRLQDGITMSTFNPAERRYVVEFSGTRAAYLRGFYEPHHPIGGWPYIGWDIRSYANHPQNASVRVYVQGFYAHEEIRRLINAMERVHGTTNIFNKYINDNLLRFQLGVQLGKTPEQIEKAWSHGMMESLGYGHVEVFDTGFPKGGWNGVSVHWCKFKTDLKSKA